MTEQQAKTLKSVGIHFPFLWAVIATTPKGFIVKNRLTREVRHIYDPERGRK